MRKYKDAIVGGLVILAAVGLFAASLTIQSLSLNLIKADLFPKMDAILLGILGIALLWDGLRKAGQASEESKGEEKSGMSQGTRCMIITLALIAVYIFCLEPIGFLLSTFVYLVIQMLVLADESHRKKKDILLFVILSLVVSAGIYLLFTRVFYLMLPSGLLG